MPKPDEATDFLAPERLAEAHPRWTVEHRRESAALGGFLVWPDLSVGTLFDSNPFHEHRPRASALGVELTPRLLAEHDTGLHRTDFYASGDLRLYPDLTAADAADGRAGVLHDWLARPDLTIRLQSEVNRRTDPVDSVATVSAAAGQGLIFETDVLGAGSVQKTFDRVFVSVSATALRASFTASAPLRSAVGSRDLSAETVGTLKGRVGYLFPSSVYAFVEPTANWRALDVLPGVSSGTRTTAGLGVAHFGLLGGEVFAGFQAQDYPAPFTSQSAPVIGGRLTWSPHPAWSISAQFDQNLGEVAVGTLADTLGTPERTDTALASAAYQLSPLWRAQLDAGAIWIDYAGVRRADRLSFADLRLDYAVSRSFAVTGFLRVSSLESTLSSASYGRAAATLAATYHY